ENAGFPRKYGASWTTHSSKAVFGHDFKSLAGSDVDIAFAERKQEGVDLPYTYHVNRAEFDKLLLDHSKEFGAKVFEEAEVFSVAFVNAETVEVAVRIQGEERVFKCKILVDASGRRTFVGNKLGIKIKDPVFDQCALHTWFRNFNRSAFDVPDNIYIHFIPVSNSWVWQIPITEDITSFGVVTQKKNFPTRPEEREKFFWDCIKTRPDLFEQLQKAQQDTPFSIEADYSYAMTELCGDNFVLVGDAARFVDPIFSSGVSVALNSSRMASADIIEAIRKGSYKKNAFDRFEKTLRKGVNNWYNFISMYYRLNVLFTYFVNNPDYRLKVLKFLQGDVYDDTHNDLLSEMETIIKAVEDNPNHPLHDYLGTLTAKGLNI
ncbi:MAG: NAD(P)/FAD-dependent oxidoreductase, partial [Flavobacteriales bacterium]